MSSTLATKKPDSAEILTQITGQQVLKRHLTPRIMFLSAVTTVLVGVAYADRQLAEEEKRYLQEVLNQLVSSRSGMRKLASLMLKGIRQNKTYAHLDTVSCLTDSLSVSEKLIILGFGYRLAIADGHAEPQERQYLDTVASTIGIPTQQVKALFSCLEDRQSEVSPDAIKELRWLLDPQRFQNIDAAIVNAASSLSSKFSVQAQNSPHPASAKLSYTKLEKFQGYQEQLSQICTELLQVLQVEGDYDIFPSVLEDEVRSLSQKVQSQKFRLAIVGEFSQGKSTFLNALLGEELQPVRAIPCSGTLTVLKYGAEKRVICHYKDGTQAVIPFDQYQQKVSIPMEAALGNLELELAESDITEIVLEHPGLALCRHHVEIVDSPGLNEHPNRTAITERLLQDTDAAIFLANAQRPMTKGERDLLQSLRHRLQKEDSGAPADNLFVLINFMDLLRSPEDAAQVKTLVKNVVRNPSNPIVNNDNRVHFVSARSALEATLTQTPNEHSKPFTEFVSALETFLVDERGELTLEKGIADTREFILGIQDNLEQTKKVLEGNLKISAAEHHRILEKIGDISGFDVKAQALKESLVKETILEISGSWEKWLEGLASSLFSRSNRWMTIREKEENIYREYVENFQKDVSEVLDSWIEKTVVQTILKSKIDRLDSDLSEKLAVIQKDLQSIDDSIGTVLSKQFELSGMGSSFEFHSKLKPNSIGFWKGLGLVVGGVTVASLFPTFLVGNLMDLLGNPAENRKKKLRMEVLNKGIDEFLGNSREILEKITGHIESEFECKAQDFHKSASASISILCNLLEQQESTLQETLAQKETESSLIQQKNLQLKAIEKALDDLIETTLG